MREEDLYELANDELNSRNRKADLWARACALATDDVDEARYLYTNLRVEELAVEHDIDLTSAQSIPPKELTELDLADVSAGIGEDLGAEASSDDDTSLLADDAETLAGRFANQDDELNLTPAQLALKRVTEGMPEDAAAEPGDAGKDKTPAAMVLGDLTKDPGTDVDNTIQIDAETSVVARAESESLSLGSDTELDARPDDRALASSNAFFAKEDAAPSAGTNLRNTEPSASQADDSTLSLTPDTDISAADLSISDTPSQASVDTKADSLKAGIGAVGAGVGAGAAAVAAGVVQNKTSESGTGEDASTQTNPARPLAGFADNTDKTLQLDTPTVSTAAPALRTSDAAGVDDIDDLHALTGVDQATVDASRAENIAAARQADASAAMTSANSDFTTDATGTSGFDNDVDSTGAMQSTGGRSFAIYQHPSGVVNAVPQGNNVKAMLLTLPWLVSRKLWGHSIIYCLLWVVLAVALLACASLVMRQWPEVPPVDLVVTGLFALLALVGLFILPYKFANRWQESKVSAKGFSYHSDRRANTVAAAEQSFLLDPRNRAAFNDDDATIAGAA